MYSLVICILLSISYCFSSTPQFQQTFTTYNSFTEEGTSDYGTDYVDWNSQIARSDYYYSSTITYSSIHFYNSQGGYFWTLNDTQITDCVQFTNNEPMEPFTWPNDLDYVGEEYINDTECYEYWEWA